MNLKETKTVRVTVSVVLEFVFSIKFNASLQDEIIILFPKNKKLTDPTLLNTSAHTQYSFVVINE